MNFFVDQHGNLYCGDMQPGDREATAAEVAAKLLGDVVASKLTRLDTDCKATIYAGFSSPALGEKHTYPAKDTDQSNLQASVLASMYPNLPADWTTPFWCADESGAWAMRPHTVVQIQQVGVDGKSAIIGAIQRKAKLQTALMAVDLQAADAAEQLAAITWPSADQEDAHVALPA